MLAVSVSISQSRSWRDENKTIGMCVKGGAPTTSVSGGLFSFTLPTGLPTNSTGSGATGFAGASSFSDFDALRNPFSYRSENIFTAYGGMIERAGSVRSEETAYGEPIEQPAMGTECCSPIIDGIPDGWIDNSSVHPDANDDNEKQRLEGEDKNLNGTVDYNETDPNDADTDGDGLLDGGNISSNKTILLKGKDPDDLPTNDNDEYLGELAKHSALVGKDKNVQMDFTDPLNPDTDGDGLEDGKEISGDLRNKTDPSRFDSDGDGLSDKQELDGWDVTIISGRIGEKIDERHVYSDPWDNHTDGDDLSDKQEFMNSSDPTREDTDGDGLLDSEELPG
ncbi:MAG: hypothetical protein V5A88_06515, partial [Candidatus Thermoplasmatota archaeon]